ncbi:MAG: NUDIX hydrolase [Cyanobacteria bacterium]|nr:NUDIX hydrolase [Cyanobacteriota bacterium]MDW8201074.1 NUDIX hydrolase [Cyanobacteriota bacterium SKYGB_h_bin112]
MRLFQFAQRVLKIIFRHPVVGTSIIPVLPDGTIAMIRRSDTRKWAFPGGMVDWGEDIATTVRRELREETGLQATQIRRLVGIYSSPSRDTRIHSICILVEVAAEGTISIRDPFEVLDVRAFPLDAIPIGHLSHDHDQQLQDYLSGQTILS